MFWLRLQILLLLLQEREDNNNNKKNMLSVRLHWNLICYSKRHSNTNGVFTDAASAFPLAQHKLMAKWEPKPFAIAICNRATHWKLIPHSNRTNNVDRPQRLYQVAKRLTTLLQCFDFNMMTPLTSSETSKASQSAPLNRLLFRIKVNNSLRKNVRFEGKKWVSLNINTQATIKTPDEMSAS